MANVIEGARVAEAIATIGTIRSGIERCFLMRGEYEPSCNPYWSDNSGDWEKLSMVDPGDVPGAYFNRYFVYVNPFKDAYFICAVRDEDVNFSGDECYYLCWGDGVTFNIGDDGCGGGWGYPADGKFRWASKSFIQPFLPKSN